jgi:hypothetical protein
MEYNNHKVRLDHHKEATKNKEEQLHLLPIINKPSTVHSEAIKDPVKDIKLVCSPIEGLN